MLIGREAELDALTEAMEAALGGRASAVVVSGEAGIGKTRLLREVKERASAYGAETVIGGCIPLSEGALPYVPVIAALRQGLTRLPDPPSLSAEGKAQLARLLPEFRSLNGTAPTGSDQTRLFGAVLDLIRALSAGAPLVFIIEDLHWSDTSTRDLLTYLLNMTEEERVLFLCSLRTGELDPSHPIPKWVQMLATSRMAELVELQPLSREETTRQMKEITGTRLQDSIAAEIYQRSEGNPFFVEELIQASDAENRDLPPSLRDLFMQRITAVPDDAIEIVKAASVDGPTVPHELLAAATGVDDATLTPLLQSTIDRHLLVRTDDDAYAFRHSLLREAVYRRLLPGERRAFHRSFAQALEQQERGPLEANARTARLAHHWQEAGDPERALPYALTAGAEAEASFASSEAVTHYEQALRLWDRVASPEGVAGLTRIALLERIAEAADRAGRPEQSVVFWEEANDLVDRAADPATAAQILSSLAYVRGCSLMDAAGAAPLLQEAQRLVKDLPSSIEKAEVVSHAAGSLTLTGQIDEGLAMAKWAMEIADEVGDPVQRSNALSALALAFHQKGDPQGAISQYLLAIELAREQGNATVLRRTLTNLSDALFRANRPEDAVTCALDAIDELHRLGDDTQAGMLRCNVGEFLTALGRWDEAEELIAPHENAPIALDRAFSASLLAEIDVGRGRFEQARARLRTTRRLLVNMNEPQFLDPITLTEISLALWERQHDAASALVQETWEVPRDERGLARLCALGIRVEADRALRARASGAADVEEQAIRLGSEIEERCALPTTRLPEVRALQRSVAAEASRLRGHSDSALWKEATGAWKEVSFTPQLTYALYRYGESLLSAGDRNAARAALTEAGTQARELGAAPLALEIEGLARRARLKLSEAAGPIPAGVAASASSNNKLGLTDREVEVLRRVSEGLTNKQIAEALYISPKTASIHVSSILAKLGVASRTEAARRAYDAGLLDLSETT